MNMFIGHKLELTEDGYNIILELDPNRTLAEFAKEFECEDNEKNKCLYERIHKYAKRNFSNLKIKKVKLVVGSLLLVSIPFTSVSALVSTPTVEQNITNKQVVNVKLDNKIQQYSKSPFLSNGTTYVPLREITESVGGTVVWNEGSKTITVNKGDNELIFVTGSSTAMLNGKSIPMPQHYIIDDRVMIPVKFIGEILDLNVEWDEYTKTVILTTKTTNENNTTEIYTVQSGDTLWKISNKFNVSIDSIKKANNLTGDILSIGQKLSIPNANVTDPPIDNTETYTVQAGDTLWKISNKFNVSIDSIRKANNLTGDILSIGQKLSIPNTNTTEENPPTDNNEIYTVQAGDTLWKIATKYNVSIDSIRKANNLTGDILKVNQKLVIPVTVTTYVVEPGDTLNGVAQKFGTSPENILKYNYMDSDDFLIAGETISISTYAPRNYTITSGEDITPLRVGKIVDWFMEGQYLIKRNDVFTITDVDTGLQFKVKMMGGYNHSDIEPLTAADTAVMSQLFGTWTWSPRAVVIFHDGMNIAASLSGMPHAQDTIPENNVTGHFDLYLSNSLSHNTGMPSEDHENMVQKAAKGI